MLEPVPARAGFARRLLLGLAKQPRWALFLLFAAVLFLRHPQGILHADFWAQDGCVWYADAYNIGWRSLLLPYGGYLQAIPRLAALFAQSFPLRWGPTIFAVSALVIQALPPLLLMSRRLDQAWPNPAGRMGFALLYVLLPNSWEVLTNLTNAQWHLACLAFVILATRPSSNKLIEAAELTALVISGLTGPFSLFLLPIAIWRFLGSRTGTNLFRLIMLIACAGTQTWFLVQALGAIRLHMPPGASPILLARILAGQIVLGASLGIRLMFRVTRSWVWDMDAVPLAIALVGLCLCCAAFYRGGALLRKGMILGILVLAAGLLTPVMDLANPQWTMLTQPGGGNRFFFVPELAWLGVFFSLAAARTAISRLPALAFLIMLPAGLVADFYAHTAPPTDFARRVAIFGNAPAGTRMTFPVHPADFPPLILTKR